MGERQVLPGYCLLLPDPVVAAFERACAGAARPILADMALVGDALLAVTAGAAHQLRDIRQCRSRAACAYIPAPRAEPQATRTAQPWALDWNAAPIYSEALHGEFKRRIGVRSFRRKASCRLTVTFADSA